jgi:hypothetical protein
VGQVLLDLLPGLMLQQHAGDLLWRNPNRFTPAATGRVPSEMYRQAQEQPPFDRGTR